MNKGIWIGFIGFLLLAQPLVAGENLSASEFYQALRGERAAAEANGAFTIVGKQMPRFARELSLILPANEGGRTQRTNLSYYFYNPVSVELREFDSLDRAKVSVAELFDQGMKSSRGIHPKTAYIVGLGARFESRQVSNEYRMFIEMDTEGKIVVQPSWEIHKKSELLIPTDSKRGQ